MKNIPRITKYFALLIVSFCVMTKLSAQVDSTNTLAIKNTIPSKGKWTYGPIIGATASTISEIPATRNIPPTNFEPLDEKVEYIYGAVFGGFINYKWPSQKFGASVELLYTQRGAMYEFSGTRLIDNAEITEKISFKYNYLSVPILLRYYPYRGLNIGVGPQMAFNLTPTNIKYESTTNGVAGFNDLSTQQLQRQWLKAKGDLGMVFALGYEFKFGMIIDFKYFQGQSDVIETQPNNGNYIEADNRSSSFSLSLMYRIPQQL